MNQSSSNNHSPLLSETSNSGDKYNGMLPKSKLKIARNFLLSFYLYIQDNSPDYSVIHLLIGCLRFLQLLAPALMTASTNLYGEGTRIFQMMKYVSVLFYFCPSTLRQESTTLLSFIYIFFFLVFFSLFIGFGFYFKMKSYLPNWVTIVLNFLKFFSWIYSPPNDIPDLRRNYCKNDNWVRSSFFG